MQQNIKVVFVILPFNKHHLLIVATIQNMINHPRKTNSQWPAHTTPHSYGVLGGLFYFWGKENGE